MRLLFYLPALADGGIEKVVYHLVKGLAASFEVGILAQYKNRANVFDSETLPMNVCLFPASANVGALKHLSIPSHILRLRKTLAEFRPQILISAYPRVHLTTGLALQTMQAGKRPYWLAWEHGDPSRYLGVNPITSTLKKLLINIAVRGCRHLAVSHCVAQQAKGLYSEAFFEVIRNPVVGPQLAKQAQAPVDHPWFREDKPIILSMGRLTVAKGFADLIKALAVIRRQFDARLVILGEGGEKEKLSALANELGVSAHLWMPGFVANPYNFLAGSTVFAFPSYSEGSPVSVVEAMALGIPVVAYDLPPMKETIGNAGCLVSSGSIEGMANAIIDLLRCPSLRESLSDAGIQRSTDLFSVGASVQAFTDLFIESGANTMV